MGKVPETGEKTMSTTALAAVAAALSATAAATALHVGLGHEGPAACLPEVAFAIACTGAAAIAALRAKSLAFARRAG